jgi:hypothetical protein
MGTLLNRRRYMGGGGGYPADAIMTIETNPEVLAVCYAQGWCANDKYMTASEAAAVTDIGTVFKDNSSITHFEEFEYFTGVTSLANRAFYNCPNLLTLCVPINVGSIDDSTFRDNGIKNLSIKATNITSWGNTYTFANNVIENLYVNSSDVNFAVPNVSIHSNFRYLKKLEVGTNVVTLGIFQSASLLTDVIIPEGVENFRDNCFKGCSSLVSITLPSTTKTMTHGVFHTCANLTSVTILATTPPTGVSGYTFQDTPNAIVYVPSGSVNAYKTASGWSGYASRIQAIPT